MPSRFTKSFRQGDPCVVSRTFRSATRAARPDHRRGRRHVFEFVSDDVDVVGEQLERLDVAYSAQVAFSTTSNAGESGSGETPGIAGPARAAAIASIRPNCPPPRIRMVSPGFSFTGFDCHAEPPGARQPPRSAVRASGDEFAGQRRIIQREHAGGEQRGADSAGFPDRQRPNRNPAGIWTMNRANRRRTTP
jgi:hypothetical protein